MRYFVPASRTWVAVTVEPDFVPATTTRSLTLTSAIVAGFVPLTWTFVAEPTVYVAVNPSAAFTEMDVAFTPVTVHFPAAVKLTGNPEYALPLTKKSGSP